MKNLALAFIGTLLICLPTFAQEKRASPARSAEMRWGDLSLKINYSSPSVKGRTIFGELEPWGKVWRAGANEATTMELSKDAMINGEKLAAGKYAFFIIPNEGSEWVLIFNKVHEQWGAYKYDKGQDALRINVSPEQIDNVESLTYRISDAGEVNMEWSTTRVGFTIK